MDFNDEQLELIENIKKKNWSRVEEIWLQMMENPSDDIEFYKLVAGTVYRNRGASRLPDYWEILLGYFADKKDLESVLTLARSALQYEPEAPNLHPFVLQAVKELNSDCPRLDTYIRRSHLKDKFHLGQCLEKCEEFLYFDEGTYFQHVNWGVGEVVELDLTQEKVIINFPQQKFKPFTFEGARQYLTKLPSDHFLVLLKTDPDRLRKMRDNDPIGLVKLILKSFNREVSQSDLKAHVTGNVMEEKGYSSWWTKVKRALRNDPWIELGTGTKPAIRLRKEAMGYFDEMLQRFEKAHTLEQKRRILKELAQHQKGDPLPIEKARPFAARVRQWHSGTDVENFVGRLKMIYLMEETANLMPSPPAPLEDSEDAILGEIQDIPAILWKLEIFDYQCRCLDRLLILRKDEIVRILQGVYMDAPTKAGQYAFEKLLERGATQAGSQSVKRLLDHFDRNPETYAWTVRQILKKKWKDIESPYLDFSLLVDALHHLERTRFQYESGSPSAKASRDLQTHLRQLFTGEKFAILTSILKDVTASDARRLHNSLLTSPAFNSAAKDTIDNFYHKIRPDVFEKEEDKEYKPRLHYCTAETLKIKQDELRRVKTVEIPRNTKEIETARAHGDLSENAEYDAAKERQAMLMKRMQQLQDLIARARIINPDTVQTAQISIGTRFQVRNLDTGEMETYSLLGLWEADPDHHVLSFESPLGKKFLGKKPDESVQVELPGGAKVNYEVISIENAFQFLNNQI